MIRLMPSWTLDLDLWCIEMEKRMNVVICALNNIESANTSTNKQSTQSCACIAKCPLKHGHYCNDESIPCPQ